MKIIINSIAPSTGAVNYQVQTNGGDVVLGPLDVVLDNSGWNNTTDFGAIKLACRSHAASVRDAIVAARRAEADSLEAQDMGGA